MNISLCFDFSQIFFTKFSKKVKRPWITLFFYQNDIFRKLAILSPLFTPQLFPLSEFLKIWPWMKYISFFAKYWFLWIFLLKKSDFSTFGQADLTATDVPHWPPHNFFCLFLLHSNLLNRKKWKVKKIQAIFSGKIRRKKLKNR